MLTAREIIAMLDLAPLEIEGGYFRETYRSNASANIGVGGVERSLSTAIYYLHTPDTFSALHKLPGDEVYHFYLGDPVELLMLHPDGSSEVVILGTDLAAGHRPQCLMPGGSWQGSRLVMRGKVALIGTTMAPGFDYNDFTAGERALLIEQYPTQATLITALTK